MLNIQELDHLDHNSWGLINKKCRGSCISEISSETWDALLMICRQEVRYVCFRNFRFNTRKNNQYLFCCRKSNRTSMGRRWSPCSICWPNGRSKSTSAGSCSHVWRPGGKVALMWAPPKTCKQITSIFVLKIFSNINICMFFFVFVCACTICSSTKTILL